jgi:hypothetical protein
LTYYCSTDRNEWTKGFDARFGLCTEAEARKFFTVHSEIAYVNEDAVGYIRNFNLNLAISAISAQNLAIFANFPLLFIERFSLSVKAEIFGKVECPLREDLSCLVSLHSNSELSHRLIADVTRGISFDGSVGISDLPRHQFNHASTLGVAPLRHPFTSKWLQSRRSFVCHLPFGHTPSKETSFYESSLKTKHSLFPGYCEIRVALVAKRGETVLVIRIAGNRFQMFSLFSSTKVSTSSSSTSLSELDQVAALKETIDGLNLLLNDDLNGRLHWFNLMTIRGGEDINIRIQCIS